MADEFGVLIKKAKTVPVIDWKFVDIPAGEFFLKDEIGSYKRTISRIKMSNMPVTQKLYEKVNGANPSKLKGELRPVDSVTWFDAIIFCNNLSKLYQRDPCYKIAARLNLETVPISSSQWLTLKCDFTANGFRLPTESEWEFAARGGTDYLFSGSNNIDEVAWYGENSEVRSHDVGTKLPNAFGLYDMCGNVSEWCWDIFAPVEPKDLSNSKGPVSGTMRVKRGGCWLDDAKQCTVSFRSGSAPTAAGSTLGFRVCSIM